MATARPAALRPRLLLILVVLLALGYGVYRYAFTTPPPPAFITAPATRQDIEDTVLANGTLQAFKQVSVGAQVSGQVKSLKVKLGDEVRQGQLVAEIDSVPQQNKLRNAEAALASIQAQLASARATLAQGEITQGREQRMRAEDATSQANLDAADAAVATGRASVRALQAQVEQARITVDTARVDLGYARIVSPIAGQVVAIVTEEGTTVNANQAAPTIIIVAQVDTMTVKASISEADVTSVKPGQRVYFTILGEPDKRYQARLRTIEPATDAIRTSGSATALGSSTSAATTANATAIYYNGLFDVDNADRALRISMTAQVYIVRGEAKGAVTIPAAALSARTTDGRYEVSVLDAQGQPQARQLRIGMNNKVRAQVLEGLVEGEQVVLGDAKALTDSGPRRGPPRM
ncbi:efflux RND transporter periplasmic adaptor subunit [Pseudorhodoferax sp. Leaf267]|uniref:efflux RND transporter periplasmic adaptor subunit n=1 Tax=Pseudorhodoferax sp. Leaf267 TaxID=1736316 RepID=UPI0006FA8347|nr:efflux RND transporter periplasmic adaptor subunit [Pseudorhodoferax sp. Leaf267]KQP22886.1 hemolysin secretion protein D [Pseudorhodoferax sp. Leaf267]